MTPSIASQQLSNELWTSFASLLRSHVAMHSISRPDHGLRVISNSTAAVEVLGPYGKLTVLAPGSSRIGATEFRPEAGELGDEYATFIFTEDGLFQSEELTEAMDIEAAVESLLRKVQA
jgi:hypothetical protein